jgi:O-antigen ligase
MLIVLGCAVIALAFLMSGHFPPWTSFEPQWVTGLGALMLALAALLPEHAPATRRYRVPALAWGALMLAAVPLLQWAAGLVWYHSDAVLTATYLVGFSAAIVVGRSLAAMPATRLLPRLQAALLFAAIVSAGIALFQWLQLDPPTMYIMVKERGGRPFGNLAQPNHLATLLCLGLAATLYFYETRRLGGVAAAACGVLLGTALVLTESRAGWAMMIVLVVWWATQRRRVALRTAPVAVAVAALFFIAAAALVPSLSDALLLSAAPGTGARVQGGTRPVHWATLWDAVQIAPWLGYGWGQVAVAQSATALQHPPTGEWLLNSHNLLLDLFVQNGLPIGLAVLALLVWWFVRRIRACRSAEQWALLAGVGMVFTHQLVEFPLDYLYFLLPVGLTMGALQALEENLNETPAPAAAVPRSGLALVCAALAGMLGWVGVEYMQVEAAVRQQRFVMLGIGVDKVPDAPVPEVRLLDQPREYHRFLGAVARAGMSPAELEWMRRATWRAPRPHVQLRYALALGLNGQPQAAQHTLQLLCQLHIPRRCDEGRQGWRTLQQHYPVLQPIAYPDGPQNMR